MFLESLLFDLFVLISFLLMILVLKELLLLVEEFRLLLLEALGAAAPVGGGAVDELVWNGDSILIVLRLLFCLLFDGLGLWVMNRQVDALNGM